MPSPLQIVSTVSPLILKHRTNHPVPELCSTQHHLTKSVLTLRGGATIPKDALDMVHLEGVAPMMTAMSSYAVIGSLIMGSSLYLFDILLQNVLKIMSLPKQLKRVNVVLG